MVLRFRLKTSLRCQFKDTNTKNLDVSAAKGDLYACKLLACPKITDDDSSTTDEDDEDQPGGAKRQNFLVESVMWILMMQITNVLCHAVKGTHKTIVTFLVVDVGHLWKWKTGTGRQELNGR